ncbi:ferritin-like metal-binding protein YciE [Rhodovulum iodosum]|uniref:Ferritin-like metal-binding protein YciE n=1 Tax=Rhodovulum iodosum TaxID=68291 RepID=A0ABV3XWJ9_9RHOB|nr:DUF892 family protein [Rhodovulum robiginosum]RSK32140.1 DUF892 family protein [Rhodovulum robiginosum]
MAVVGLRALYLSELQEARSFEEKTAKAFDQLATLATDTDLKEFFLGEADNSRRHAARIARLLDTHGADPSLHEDQAMIAILDEAIAWAGQIDPAAARDAALVASAQRVLHYEMAVYGALFAWAKQQGLADAKTLESNLEKARKADAKLNVLAAASIYAQAAA